jgi:hypothetical protein
MTLADEIVAATQAIQAIVAPAVMITAVALLLLSFNARHSVIVNRIRLLDDEKRTLGKRRAGSARLDRTDHLRIQSITHQIDLLLPRLAYVRNGMLCQMLAVLFFVLTSFTLGLEYFSVPIRLYQEIANITFIAGMLLVLIGVAFLAMEIYVSYRVMEVEIREAWPSEIDRLSHS